MKRIFGLVIFSEKEYNEREANIDRNFTALHAEMECAIDAATAWQRECFKTRQLLSACSDCADNVAIRARDEAKSLADSLQESLVKTMLRNQSRARCPIDNHGI